MKRRLRRIDTDIVKLVIVIATLVIIVGKGIINLICTETGNDTSYTAEEACDILQEADEIKICKNYRTLFKKDYSIIVDGDRIATVEGEVFKLFGDTFTMYSSNGKKIGYEKEEKLHLNRQAQFYNADGDKTGRLHSKFFALLRKDTFHDADDTAIARCDEQFTFLFPDKYVIHDLNGNDLFTIDKAWWFDNYILTVKEEGELDVVEAIFINCIEDAVSGSSSSSSSSSSSKSK